MTAQYVYGVTYAETTIADGLRGVEDGLVALMTHGRCAALVSELPGDRELGTRDDLMSHERVLETLVREGVPLLPFSFGTVMPGPDVVADEVLSGNQDEFIEELDRIVGHVQLTVKGRYEGDTAYREILKEDPEILRLRDQIRDMSEDASYYERVRLGELVAQALTNKQTADGERLVDAMAPYAESVLALTPDREDRVVDAAFLVKHDRLSAFEEAIERLGAEWAGQVRLRMLGPLAPYDFVAALAGQEA